MTTRTKPNSTLTSIPEMVGHLYPPGGSFAVEVVNRTLAKAGLKAGIDGKFPRDEFLCAYQKYKQAIMIEITKDSRERLRFYRKSLKEWRKNNSGVLLDMKKARKAGIPYLHPALRETIRRVMAKWWERDA